MNVSLILQRKDGSNKVFPVRNKKAVILGRGPDCDLCIPLQVVSRKHCQLNHEIGTLKVRDLKSSNGTYLNGNKVENETLAGPGDHIQIGPLTFTVQIDGTPAEITAPDKAMIQPSPDISEVNPDLLGGSATFTGK